MITNRLKLIYSWFVKHPRLWKALVGLLLAVIASIALPNPWDWIGANSSALIFIATLLTGGALGIFSYLTYRLSRQMTEYQIAPPIQFGESYKPEITEDHLAGEKIENLKWQIRLTNVGAAPAWVQIMRFEASLLVGAVIEEWTTVKDRIHLSGVTGIQIQKSFVVDGRQTESIGVLIHLPSETFEELKKKTRIRRNSKERKQFVIRVIVRQQRQLISHTARDERRLVSQKFEV